ncbi:MAG: DNA repair protein [Phycisphaerales bacterium]
MSAAAVPAGPVGLAQRLGELRGIQRRLDQEQSRDHAELAAVKGRIDLYPKVAAALQVLSEKLFRELLDTLEQKLTIALQEVLGQPLTFHAEAAADQKSGVTVELKLKLAGKDVSIMDGSGGSVANVLSVGLRMFALASLDPAKHARVLIMDEPDCWLRPDLVPRLAKIIADASRALGFQVILISHHEIGIFRQYADRIIRLEPGPEGVRVEHIDPRESPDAGES